MSQFGCCKNFRFSCPGFAKGDIVKIESLNKNSSCSTTANDLRKAKISSLFKTQSSSKILPESG